MKTRTKAERQYVRTDVLSTPDKIVVENSQTGARQNYYFADPIHDPQQIRDGIINKLIFVSQADIKDILTTQGAFNPSIKNDLSNFRDESVGGSFDYSYAVIPKRFALQGASNSPLYDPSPMLFLPEGDSYVHNHMNFGNYLWAATGYTIGFNYSDLQLMGHLNNLYRCYQDDAPLQFDSQDDQLSIIKGAYLAHKNKFR